jgi:UDP:flavonoid glycosyltransferase YjiC (YdhE family)
VPKSYNQFQFMAPFTSVPFGRDQFEVARRVEVSGAGTRLPASELTVGGLAGLIETTLACHPQAARIAAGFAAAGGPPAAASAVEGLLDRASVSSGAVGVAYRP